MSVPLPRHAVFVIVQELSRARPPGKLPGQTCESFAARLTDDQRNVFFAHLDDAVRGAYALARKSGDGGRHAIATGALDDVALEHWAKQVAAGKVEAGRNIKSFAYGAGRYAALSYLRRARVVEVRNRSEPAAPEFDPAADARREALREALSATDGQVPAAHEDWVKVGLSLGLCRRVVSGATKARLPRLVVEALRERVAG